MTNGPSRPAPKNPGFVTCRIDGNEVVVPPGTNMVEAAAKVGSDIPYYCYHSKLSIAASCRMCMVEVKGTPKLVPACQTPLSEGMEVMTSSEKVKAQQRATLELLLLNHPVDCPICDQAGECKLQDYYMEYDARPSRLEGKKALKNKRKILGPQVILDQERCILCTRCVRFMNEIAKETQLGVFGRGSHEVIDVFPGAELSSNYSGNTVDLCPVGALLSRDFRFRARAWFLSSAPSTCAGCSRGCSVFADFYGNDVFRYRPRENPEVNQCWLCDQGRLSYKTLSKHRVVATRVGRGAEPSSQSPAEAAKIAVQKLLPLAKLPELAVLASPMATNEDLLAALWFAREVLGTKEVFVTGRASGESDHFLMTADKNPNRKGLEWIAKGLGLELLPFSEFGARLGSGKVKALWAVGGDLPETTLELLQRLDALEWVVVQATNTGALVDAAHVLLPAATHLEDEGSFVNAQGLVQRHRSAFPPRDGARPHWSWVRDFLAQAGYTTSFSSAGDVFRELAPKVPELSGFDWKGKAPRSVLGPGNTRFPAPASDGPSGQRPSPRQEAT